MVVSINTIKKRDMKTEAFFTVFLGSFVLFSKDGQSSF
nr:MAG TPA: hypothetical protein [Caudoviricetes sp.]